MCAHCGRCSQGESEEHAQRGRQSGNAAVLAPPAQERSARPDRCGPAPHWAWPGDNGTTHEHRGSRHSLCFLRSCHPGSRSASAFEFRLWNRIHHACGPVSANVSSGDGGCVASRLIPSSQVLLLAPPAMQAERLTSGPLSSTASTADLSLHASVIPLFRAAWLFSLGIA